MYIFILIWVSFLWFRYHFESNMQLNSFIYISMISIYRPSPKTRMIRMIILVQASIILGTRMISKKKKNMILRAWSGGNFHHPIIILVFLSWQRRVGLSIFGRGGRVGAGPPTLTAVVILASSYPNGPENVQNSTILSPSYLLGSRSSKKKKNVWASRISWRSH